MTTMTIRKLTLALLTANLIWSQPPAPGNPSPATVKGQVLDSTGKGLAFLPIHLIQQYSPSTGFHPSTLATLTSTDGSFTFGLVPPGRYVVCARPQAVYVDHCLWNGPQAFDLATGQSLTVSPLQLQTGYKVQIKVLDPSGLITRNESKSARENLTVGVTTPQSVFIPSRAFPAVADEKNFEVVVPLSSAFVTRVHSSFYQLTDASGAPVDSGHGASVPSQTNAGATPMSIVPIVFHVVGLH